MRQYINASIKLPGAAYTLEFYGIFKTDKDLIVITEAKPKPGVIGTCQMQQWTSYSAIFVEVNKQLPVRHYHLNGGDIPKHVTSINNEDLGELTKGSEKLSFTACSYSSSFFSKYGLIAAGALGVSATIALTYKLSK